MSENQIGGFWKLLAVASMSALLSGSLVAVSLRVGLAETTAELRQQTISNTRSIENLSVNVGTLSDMFRSQLVESARLAARLDAYIQAVKDQSKQE